MSKDGLRRLFEQRLGVPGRALLAWRTRGQAEALLAGRGLAGPAADLAAALGTDVRRGPFIGMHYPRRRGDIVHVAKLLGAYECELHPAVERLIARRPTRVLNVGSGDGYYAVGLARRLPEAMIDAVDPDPLAQRACTATARLNKVTGIRQVVRLDAAGLEAELRRPDFRTGTGHPRALVVVDCEGFEDELLDPALAPSLLAADLLVETHDFARIGVTRRLKARFGATHRVEEVAVAPREPSLYPELASFSPIVAAGLLDEFRHQPQSWLVLTRLASAA